MEKEEIIASMIMELRRGTIILCVLSQLDKPMYGYNLVSDLSNCGIAVEANTLYPLLRRLESQGLHSNQRETQERTKPRKYYVITSFGTQVYEMMKEQWNKTVKSMDSLIK